MPKYITGGKTYNIPDEKISIFEADYPDATIEYHIEGETYDIPLKDKQDFIKQYPNATTSAPKSTIEQLREDTKKRKEAAEKAYNESEVIYNEDKPYRPASVPQPTPAPVEGIVKAESDKLVQEQEAEKQAPTADDMPTPFTNSLKKKMRGAELPSQREYRAKMEEINRAERYGAITPKEAFIQRNAAQGDLIRNLYIKEKESDKAYVDGFWEAQGQSWKSLGAGLQNLAGETLNLVTGSSIDDEQALSRMEQLEGEGKDVRQPLLSDNEVSALRMLTGQIGGAASVFATPSVKKDADKRLKDNEINILIHEAMDEAGNDIKKAKAILKTRAADKSAGDKWIESASQTFKEMKPTKGAAAWVGNLLPQMVPTAASLVVTAITKSPTLGKIVGGIGMGGMTASTAGQSMSEARDYGASNAEMWTVGLTDALIEVITEYIPFDIYTNKIFKGLKTNIGKELADAVSVPNSPANRELGKLLTQANKSLDGKLLNGKNVKDFLKSAAAEGISEFTAEALQTMTPMLYQNPEDYPTFNEIFRNGVEGAKGGIFMGMTLGGGSKMLEHKVNRERRKENGFVDVAQLRGKDGESVYAEIISTDVANNNLKALIDGEIRDVKASDVIDRYTFTFEEFDRGYMEKSIDEAYEAGRAATSAEQMNHIKRELEDAANEIRNTYQLGEDKYVDEFLGDTPLEDVRGSLKKEGSEAEAELKLRYLSAKAKYDGMLARVRDEAKDEVEASNIMIDGLVNNDMGGIVNATIASAESEQGVPVNIVSGVIVTDKDGNIDIDNTDSFLIYKDKDGSLKPISKDRLMSAQPTVDVNTYKKQLAREIINRKNNEATAQIDGVLSPNVGNVFNIIDDNGWIREVRIMGEQDGMIAISIDNDKQQLIPLEQLQSMHDAYKNAEFQAQKAENEAKEQTDKENVKTQFQQIQEAQTQAEEQVQQAEQAETATSRVPVGESGNLLYEQADSDTAWDALLEQAKGNEATAQKIADMGVKKAQKALDEVKQSTINEDMSIEEMLEAENAHNDAVAAAEANLNKWKEIATTPQRRAEEAQRVAETEAKAEAMQERIDKANEAISEEQKKAEQGNPYLGRSLTSQESKAVIALMENNAQLAPELELTPENWVAEFGEDGVVSTPIGDVKMGENQYLKLLQRKRSKYFGLIKPTLTDADIILEEYDPKDGAERDTKLLFIKTFTKEDGSRYIHFESVTVQKDTKEVSISSHEINATDLQKKMHNDNVVHLKDTFLDSELRLIEPQAEGSDIVPTPNASSDNKDTTTGPQKQENLQKNSATPQMRATESAQPTGKKLGRAMNMLRIPLRKRINAWSRKVGVPVVILEDFSDVTSQKAKANILEAESKDHRVTGWVENGKVYMYMPALYDIDEIDETYTHEVVAHKGMDAMLGKEKYHQFCLDVFDQVMTEADRKFYLKYEGVKEIEDEQEKKAKAADEYIAHLSESTNLTKREAKLWDKIVDLFRKMLESLGYPQNISKLNIEDMLRKSYNNLLEKKASGILEDAVFEAAQSLEENGAQVDVQRGDVQNAVRDMLNPKQKEKTIKDIMAVTGRSRSTVEKWLKAEQSLAKIILDDDNEAFLDLQVDESVPSIWKNSDYPQGTVEFSNICRKRLPLTMIYQQLQKEFPNTVFDAVTLETIRGVLKENGVDVACGLCFVEDRRQLLGEIGQGFIDALKGKDVKLNDKQKEIVEKIKASGDTYIPNLYELITLDGMKELKREHNEIANAFVAYNSARGMQAGRLFQAYSAYHREILKYNKKKIKSINNAGGLRIFSFSDFEAHHLIDLVQVLTDCASKGIKVQGYTKVPEFARAVKATNMKVNRSLIAKGDGVVDADYVPQQGEAVSPNVINGKRLLLDTVEGIDVNHPDFFDSSSSANVGNILVGINDEHIRQAMLDPFVDYIIPFHTGIKKDILKKKGIDSWQNYKLEQLEHIRKENGKESNADKHGINIYTEVLSDDIQTEKQFVERYLEVCKEKGWLPKFHRFLDKDKNGDFKYTKGYYKFLLDFKLFNKNGRILPQEAVVPIFDNELNGRILEEYAEGERTKMPNTEVYDKVKDALQEEGKIQFRVADDIAAEQGQPMFRAVGNFKIGDNEQTTQLNSKQKNPSQKIVIPKNDISFRVSKNNRATIIGWLNRRDDLEDNEKVAFINYLDDNDFDAKTQLATSKWFVNGVIRVPEDMAKVEQAIKVATIAKVDPLKYVSPMELIDAHTDIKIKDKPIDPDTVNTLSNRREIAETGIVIYDVAESEESRQNMRKIINTHYGEKASPWCLLQVNENGVLSESSKKYWRKYSAYPKQVAFHNGKLLAFSANDNTDVAWWDNQDVSHRGIPSKVKVNYDSSEVLAQCEYVEVDGEYHATDIHIGDQHKGQYIAWYDNGQLKEQSNYKGWVLDGLSEEWYENGNKKSEIFFKNRKKDGRQISWYENGERKSIINWKDGVFNGLYETYFENGELAEKATYKDGELNGEYVSYHKNGNISYRGYYKEGLQEGIFESLYPNGKLRKRERYTNGERNGLSEEWDENGSLIRQREYANGELVEQPSFRVTSAEVKENLSREEVQAQEEGINPLKWLTYRNLLRQSFRYDDTYGYVDDRINQVEQELSEGENGEWFANALKSIQARNGDWFDEDYTRNYLIQEKEGELEGLIKEREKRDFATKARAKVGELRSYLESLGYKKVYDAPYTSYTDVGTSTYITMETPDGKIEKFRISDHPLYGYRSADEFTVGVEEDVKAFVEDSYEYQKASHDQGAINTSFRVTQDKARFDELQAEYDALDKNDEAALNAWRDKKVGVVNAYLEGVAQRFGMKPDIVAFNGADEEQMKEAYDRLVESYRKSGTTPPSYEAFKEHALDKEVFATYYRGGDIITNNTSTKDHINTKKRYAANLFHEVAHHHANILYNAKEFEEIWNDVKRTNLALVERINTSRIYKNKSNSSKGNEFLAHSIAAIVREYQPIFQQFVRGEGNITADNVVAKLGYKQTKTNFALTEILNRIKDEYQESRSRDGGNISRGVGGSRPNRVPRRVLQNNVSEQERGGGNRERGRGFVLTTFLNDVSQKGLRGVVSEDALVSFFKGVYNRVDNATRNEIYEYVKRNGNDFWNGTEQYLASLAENDTPLDGGVRDAFVQMLNDNGIEAEGLTDNDIRYMMWRTNQLKDNKGALSVAEDVVMKQKLGVDNTQPDAPAFRVVSNRRSIRDKYDKKVKTNVDSKIKLLRDMAMTSYNFQEAMQDEMLALKIFQQLLEEAYGVNIPSYLNVYNAENSLSSRNKVEMDRFVETLYEDMMLEIDKLIKAGATEQEVRDYVVAKSGIERSIEFGVRDYINEQAERKQLTDKDAKDQLAEIDEKVRNSEITPAEADAMRYSVNRQRNTNLYDKDIIKGMRELYEEKRNKLRDELYRGDITFDEWVDKSLKLAKQTTGKPVETDYAGLSTMAKRMGQEEKDWLSNARKVVNEFEEEYNYKKNKKGKQITKDATNTLWNAIIACNNATLKKLYDTGVISKDVYDKLQKQFMFYVPMSGFTEDVAEDVYSYIGNETGAFTPPIKKAGGRLSESDDPFAIIGNKMQSAILQGNRNAMKIKLLNLHRQFPTDLITEGRFWEVKQPDGSWQVEYPEIPSKDASAEVVKTTVDEFNERMKRLKEYGDARIYRGKANVPYKITHKSHENQHQITVRLMGEPITMFVNGNPQLAKAINGKLGKVPSYFDFNKMLGEYWQKAKRFSSATKTSWNPNFIAPNVLRDFETGVGNVFLEYGIKDAGRLIVHFFPALGESFMQTIGFGSKGKIGQHFEEFIRNGGETGYSHIDNIDAWKKKARKRWDRISKLRAIPRLGGLAFEGLGNFISAVNGIFEDATRFAAYRMHRTKGESIVDSIKAAKDISTNFNKKGADGTEGIWGFTARFLRNYKFLFFNPMVQGVYRFGSLAKQNKGRASVLVTLPILAGFFNAMWQDLRTDDEDDEKKYLNQNPFTRRTHLMIFTGEGYVKIPLTQILRELYAVGDIAYCLWRDNISKSQAALAIFNTLRSIVNLEGQSSLTGEIGDDYNPIRAFLPQVADPVTDVAFNEDFTGSPIYRDASWDQDKPQYQRVYQGTWQWLINISRKMEEFLVDMEGSRSEALKNYDEGVSSKRSSKWMNAGVWQHLLESTGGGLLTTITDGITSLIDWEDEDARVDRNRIPIARRFYSEPSERTAASSLLRDYYNITNIEQIREKQRYENFKAATEGKATELIGENIDEENAFLDRVEETKDNVLARAKVVADYHSKEKVAERKRREEEAEALSEEFNKFNESEEGQFYLKTEEIIKAVDKLRREIKKVEDDGLKKQKKAEMEAKMRELVELWKADKRK